VSMDYERVYEEVQIRVPKYDGLLPIGDIADEFYRDHWEFLGMIDAEDFMYLKFRKIYIHGNPIT
jgi:hypothetical protein